MKLVVKLILIAGVLAIAGPYFIKGADGRPLLEMPDLSLRDISLKSSDLLNTNNDLGSSKNSENPSVEGEVSEVEGVFKWQDADGQWNFSDKAPGHLNAQQVHVNQNQNIIQSLETAKLAAAKDKESEQDSKPKTLVIGQSESGKDKEKSTLDKILDGDDGAVSPFTVPLSEVPALIEEAKNIQQVLNDRVKTQSDQH